MLFRQSEFVSEFVCIVYSLYENILCEKFIDDVKKLSYGV